MIDVQEAMETKAKQLFGLAREQFTADMLRAWSTLTSSCHTKPHAPGFYPAFKARGQSQESHLIHRRNLEIATEVIAILMKPSGKREFVKSAHDDPVKFFTEQLGSFLVADLMENAEVRLNTLKNEQEPNDG